MAIRLPTSMVLVALLALGACGDDDDDASGDIEGVQTFKIGTPQHVLTPVEYPQTPPVGGDHNPRWVNCGFYTVVVPNELAVHSLEHGAVWITYQPDLDPASVEKLKALAADTYVLVSPYPGLPAKVAASAWGLQLKLDSVDDPRLKLFVDEYRQGEQTPEPGAPCVGGVTPAAG